MLRAHATEIAHASAWLALLVASSAAAAQQQPLSLPDRQPALILAGVNFSCAIVGAERRVACWGDDTNGELGTGKRLSREECPTPPPACAIYAHHTIDPLAKVTPRDALFETVAERRAREAEIRFLDRPSCSTRPLLLPALRGARELVTDERHANICADFDDGRVRCWGLGPDDQPTAARELPAMRGAHQLAFSNYTIIGRKAERTVIMDFDQSAPLVRDFGDWISVVETVDLDACALQRDGSVRCSRDLPSRRFLRDRSACLSSPYKPSCAPKGLDRATAIAASDESLCALDPIGQLLCGGEHGSIPGIDSWVPAVIETSAALSQVVIGGAHVCALDVHAAVWCFGNNSYGQLGDGTLQDRSNPTLVDGLPPIAQIAAGGAHTCARAENGELWCWGNNAHGQLGDGTRERRLQPVRVRKPVPASRRASPPLSPLRP